MSDDKELYPLGKPVNRPEPSPAPPAKEVSPGVFEVDGKLETRIPENYLAVIPPAVEREHRNRAYAARLATAQMDAGELPSAPAEQVAEDGAVCTVGVPGGGLIRLLPGQSVMCFATLAGHAISVTAGDLRARTAVVNGDQVLFDWDGTIRVGNRPPVFATLSGEPEEPAAKSTAPVMLFDGAEYVEATALARYEIDGGCSGCAREKETCRAGDPFDLATRTTFGGDCNKRDVIYLKREPANQSTPVAHCAQRPE